MESSANINKGLFIAASILLVLGFISIFINDTGITEPGNIFCTQDAKMCPDGTYISRKGPDCEFEECPGLPQGYTLKSYKIEKVLPDACADSSDCSTPGEYLVQSRCPFMSLCIENKCTVVCPGYDGMVWKSATDEQTGISFAYPEKLPLIYMNAFDWPPKLQVLKESFICEESGHASARSGITEKRIVNGREYCRTQLVEGAAGSIYTQYAYAFKYGDRVAYITFSIRADQCANYAGRERINQCEAERMEFDADSLVESIVSSINFER